MSDLDTKLEELLINNDAGLENEGIESFDYEDMVKEIKQAFIDAGWEPVLVLNREQSYMATGDKIYRTATLRTEDEWKARNEGKLMTSQEWLGEFIDEFMEEFKGRKYITPEGLIVDYELEKDIRKWVAAKRASS